MFRTKGILLFSAYRQAYDLSQLLYGDRGHVKMSLFADTIIFAVTAADCPRQDNLVDCIKFITGFHRDFSIAGGWAHKRVECNVLWLVLHFPSFLKKSFLSISLKSVLNEPFEGFLQAVVL